MSDAISSSYKIVVVGSSGVGKTALVQRLADGSFTGDNQTTIGVEFKTYPCKVGSDNVKLNIWDTAGQEKFRSVSKAYFRNAVGAILVFAFNDHESFDDLDGWMNDLLGLCAPNAVIILVGNKTDLTDTRTVSTSEAQSFADRYKIEFFQTSALTADNVQETFIRMATKVHEKVNLGEISGQFKKQMQPPIMLMKPVQRQEYHDNDCSC